MNKAFYVVLAVIFLLGGCSHSALPPSANPDQEEPRQGLTPEDTAPMASNQLDLSGQGLSRIPDYVFGLSDLEELDVSDNQLEGAIQAEIRQLSGLKILKAGRNQMTGVPAEIGQLKNLEVLDLSDNQLTGLPNELGALPKLKILNLSGNAYSELDLSVIQENLPAEAEIVK